MVHRTFTAGLLVGLLFIIAGCGAGSTNTDGDITLQFAMRANGEEAACGQEYADLGAAQTTASFADLRFYVSNIRLVNAQGEAVPLELAQDGQWQYANTALLDFEDGSADCSETGNPELNTTVVGTVPAGTYEELIFDLGVPFENNHLDASTAPAPLNVVPMWWNWRGGYKFVRIDMLTDTATTDSAEQTEGGDDEQPATGPRHGSDVPANSWFIHLGSIDCPSPDSATPPEAACGKPNVPEIRLTGFDPQNSVVVADVAGLLEGVNLSETVPEPVGCMSGPDDPDCSGLFPNFGLSLETGTCIDGCENQTMFRLES